MSEPEQVHVKLPFEAVAGVRTTVMAAPTEVAADEPVTVIADEDTVAPVSLPETPIEQSEAIEVGKVPPVPW